MRKRNAHKTYYSVSDLHLIGDDQLRVCDYTDEIVAFLQELGKTELN